MLRELNRDREALESFDRALGMNPDLSQALTNRGYLSWVVEERYDEAKADLTRALALEPGQSWLEGELFYLKMQGADWDSFAAGRAALAKRGHRGGRPGQCSCGPSPGRRSRPIPPRCSKLFAHLCQGRTFPALPLPAARAYAAARASGGASAHRLSLGGFPRAGHRLSDGRGL